MRDEYRVMKSFQRALRERLKRIKTIRAIGNWYRINQTVSLLKNYDDFDLRRTGGVYYLDYNDRLGYKPDHLSATLAFDYARWAWQVQVDGATVLALGCPLWELIVELRGYLLPCPLSAGDVVIDAGASTGFISSVFAKMVGSSGQVICIEPDPLSVQSLREAIRINHLDNCTILNGALSSRVGRAWLSPDGGASRVIGGDAQQSYSDRVQVETINIPALFERVAELRPAQIRLIKMDIEGSEVEVLDDLLLLLKDHRDLVVEIASYHLFQGEPTYRWIEQHSRHYAKIVTKTIYPVHTTTVLVHIENEQALERLKALPAYDEHVSTA